MNEELKLAGADPPWTIMDERRANSLLRIPTIEELVVIGIWE